MKSPTMTFKTLVTVIWLFMIQTAYCFNTVSAKPRPTENAASPSLVIGLSDILIILFFITMLTVLLVLFGTRKKIRKQPLGITPLSPEPQLRIVGKTNATLKSEISPELEAAALKRLKKFEQNRDYLAKDINLTTLAILLQINPKYVTALIIKNRDKNTTEYLNDLKINYVIHRLQTDPQYRHYTQKAITEDAGFGAIKTFAKAFKTTSGLSFAEFIEQLTTVTFIPNPSNTIQNEQQS